MQETNRSLSQRNNSIDIFRYICAVLVVAIHTNPFGEINHELGYFCTEVITRIAVPCFFAISGCFYFLGGEKKGLWVKIKPLIVEFLFWSVVYIIFDFIIGKDYGIKQFMTIASYYLVPWEIASHLWFLPALISAFIISSIFIKFDLKRIIIPLSILLYVVGCLGCSYYKIGAQIPILNKLYDYEYFDFIRRFFLMGFPFFALGGLIEYGKKYADRLTNRTILGSLAAAIIIFIGEIYLVRMAEMQRNIIITFGLYLLVGIILIVLLRFPSEHAGVSAPVLRFVAEITYFIHPMVIKLLQLVLGKMFDVEIFNTKLFLSACIISAIIGIVMWEIKLRRGKGKQG